MLDHVGVEVSDFERSKSFYEQALAPLGLKVVMELVPGVAAGFGAEFRSSGSPSAVGTR